ncbi:hypothetical protein GCM10023317_42370 [Actinopolymorpha pittospori]
MPIPSRTGPKLNVRFSRARRSCSSNCFPIRRSASSGAILIQMLPSLVQVIDIKRLRTVQQKSFRLRLHLRSDVVGQPSDGTFDHLRLPQRNLTVGEGFARSADRLVQRFREPH